jgi:predicted amidohydrolase
MLRVAAIQFKPEFGSAKVERNLRESARLVLEASKTGAKLIVLPELCTTGYSFMRAEEVPVEVIGPGNHTFDVFQALSKKLGTCIVWGMAEVDKGSKRLYNSQVAVLPEGDFYSYRKINFFGNDHLWAEPGKSNPPVFNFEGSKVGLLICRDVRDKSEKMDSFYEKGDADIVAFSANWGKGGFPATAWMNFAKGNKTHLVVSNRWGEESHNDFGHGGSCVIHPCGRVGIIGLEWDRDCIVVEEV